MNGNPKSRGCYEQRERGGGGFDSYRQGHWDFWDLRGAIDHIRTGHYHEGERTGN